MRTLQANYITQVTAELCKKANFILRRDVAAALKQAYRAETKRRAREILRAIIENAAVAEKEDLAICQDTGMPVVFVELGQNVRINGDVTSAVNKGIELGYREGCLRNSIAAHPLTRGASKYAPGIIHTVLVKGEKLKLTVLPKGFGCENKSALRMFKPTADISEIKQFIIETVKNAGPDACPPYVVGVGIGGTADYANLLAKRALLRKIVRKGLSPEGTVPRLERELLNKINQLNIGPMGLGGKTTALAVNIETYPTHIAGLPVAVNMSCHALRSATISL